VGVFSFSKVDFPARTRSFFRLISPIFCLNAARLSRLCFLLSCRSITTSHVQGHPTSGRPLRFSSLMRAASLDPSTAYHSIFRCEAPPPSQPHTPPPPPPPSTAPPPHPQHHCPFSVVPPGPPSRSVALPPYPPLVLSVLTSTLSPSSTILPFHPLARVFAQSVIFPQLTFSFGPRPTKVGRGDHESLHPPSPLPPFTPHRTAPRGVGWGPTEGLAVVCGDR